MLPDIFVDAVGRVAILSAQAFSGQPPDAILQESWQLLLGYLPSNREWRAATLQRKRREYCEAVPQVKRCLFPGNVQRSCFVCRGAFTAGHLAN